MRKITGIGVVSVHELGGLPADQVYDKDTEAIMRLALRLKPKWPQCPQSYDEEVMWRDLERIADGEKRVKEFLQPGAVWAHIFKCTLARLAGVCQKTKTPVWQIVAALEGDLNKYVDKYLLKGDFLVHATDGRFLSFMAPVVRDATGVKWFSPQENKEMLDYLKKQDINTLVIVGRYLGYFAKTDECTMCMNLAIRDAMRYGLNVIVPNTGWMGSNPVSNRKRVERIKVPMKEKIVKVPTWVKVLPISEVCQIIERHVPRKKG